MKIISKIIVTERFRCYAIVNRFCLSHDFYLIFIAPLHTRNYFNIRIF